MAGSPSAGGLGPNSWPPAPVRGETPAKDPTRPPRGSGAPRSMAAEGMGNREIAQALFVSVKTVEGQLAAAYLKLGIHNRRELPGALRHA